MAVSSEHLSAVYSEMKGGVSLVEALANAKKRHPNLNKIIIVDALETITAEAVAGHLHNYISDAEVVDNLKDGKAPNPSGRAMKEGVEPIENKLKESIEVPQLGETNLSVLIEGMQSINDAVTQFLTDIKESSERLETFEEASMEFLPQGLAPALGKLKIRDSSNRLAIYKYWEDTSKQLEVLETALTNWVEQLKQEKEQLPDTIDTTKLESATNLLDSNLHQKEGGKSQSTNYIRPVTSKELRQLPILDSFYIFESILKETLKATEKEKAAAAYEKVGAEESVGRTTEKGVEINILREELVSFLEESEEVDPLLALLVNKGLTPLSLSQSTLTRYSKSIHKNAEQFFRQIRPQSKATEYLEKFKSKLQDFVHEAEEVSKMDEFYLPILSGFEKEGEFERVWKVHEDLLKSIHDVLFEKASIYQTGIPFKPYSKKAPKKVTESLAQRGGDIYVVEVPSKEREKNKVKVNIPMDVSKALNSYYFTPLSLGTFPSEEDKPKFITTNIYKDLLRYSKNPLKEFYSRTTEEGEEPRVTIPLSVIEWKHLAEFVNRHRKGGAKEWTTGMRKMATIAFIALDKFSNSKFEEENLRTIGHLIYEMGGEDEKFAGREVKDLHEEFLEDTTPTIPFNYPIFALEHYINSPEFLRTFHPKEEWANKILSGNIQTIKSGHITIRKPILHYAQMIDDAYKTIQSSDLQNKLLDVHDVIRKIQGKPIYHGYNSLYNIDDVDYVLKHLSNIGFDITLGELNMVAKSINSFDRIAKSFGINEEAVYLAKGLCRCG